MIVRATTRQTRDGAANFANAREMALAARTLVKKSPGAFDKGEGKIVATFFIADSQIDAGLAPFFPVRGNAFSSGAKSGEQVCQLVT